MNKIPGKMKAAVLFDYGDLRITEVDVPRVAYQEVLIKVASCAICGTDPKIVASGWPNHPPLGEFIPGHEFSGTIVKKGEGVDRLNVGDRVAVEPHKGCGICENCIRGLYTTCLNYGNNEMGHRHYGFTTNGGYAEYAVNHINSVHVLPDTVSFDAATLITTAGSALYGIIRIGGIFAGETVVVSGPGPIGLMAVQLARIMGAGQIILTGTRKSRLDLGLELGADIALNIHDVDINDHIFELSRGKGADLVLECSGSAAAATDSIEYCKKNGRIAFIGIYKEPVTLNLNKVVQWNISTIGSKAEGDWCLDRLIPYMDKKMLNGESLITHRFPLEKINEAMEVYSKRIDGAIKVVIHT